LLTSPALRSAAMTRSLHDDVAGRLEAAGQRYTSSRRQLVAQLGDLERPHAIAELLELDGSQPQSSLYRNMAVLEEVGVVRRLQGADDVARFELAEDVTGHHHHHLVCTSCGTIDDVEVSPAVEDALHEAVSSARRERGFRTDVHRMELLGTCARCHD